MKYRYSKKRHQDMHEIFSNYFLRYEGANFEYAEENYYFAEEDIRFDSGWFSSIEGSVLLPDVIHLYLLYANTNQFHELFPTYTLDWNGDVTWPMSRVLSKVQSSAIDVHYILDGGLHTWSFSWAWRDEITVWAENEVKLHTKSKCLYELLQPHPTPSRKRSVMV